MASSDKARELVRELDCPPEPTRKPAAQEPAAVRERERARIRQRRRRERKRSGVVRVSGIDVAPHVVRFLIEIGMTCPAEISEGGLPDAIGDYLDAQARIHGYDEQVQGLAAK